MARVVFTTHLAEIVPKGEHEAPGGTVREALEAVFRDHPRLRGYILDDQGRVRRHVVIFVDSARCPNEAVLSMSVADATEVYVLQALSGG